MSRVEFRSTRMSFWWFIRHMNFRSLPGRSVAACSRIEATFSNPTTRSNLVQVSNIPDLVVSKWLRPLGCSLRFFAAPLQLNEKQGKKMQDLPLMNEHITYRIIRLVTEEGNFIVSRHEALQRAKKLNLDLVEVQKEGNPPVCKLMDFQKERYKQKIKQKARAKTKTKTLKTGVCKEVRFSTKIEQKDLQIKANMVVKLMERGYRVKCMATGSEDHDLSGLLERFSALIEGDSFVESGPRVEKKQAYVVVRHAKFGPPRKGGKKISKPSVTTGAGEEGGSAMWSSFATTDDVVDAFGIKNDELENTTAAQPHGVQGREPSFHRTGVRDVKSCQMAELRLPGDSPPQVEMENRYKQRKNLPRGWSSGSRDFPRPNIHGSRW